MKSRLVFVPMAEPYTGIKYGFRTTVKESTGTILGHQTLEVSTPVTGLIYKANAPKPKRASRRTATGIESSFVSPSAIAAAIAAGFDVVKARPNGRKRATQFQIPVYVTINGIKYAWGMRKTQKAKLGANFNVLGIKEANGSELDLVFGASFPKPPTATSVVVSKNGSVSATTFYDPSNEAQVKGKFQESDGQFTQSAWADFV